MAFSIETIIWKNTDELNKIPRADFQVYEKEIYLNLALLSCPHKFLQHLITVLLNCWKTHYPWQKYVQSVKLDLFIPSFWTAKNKTNFVSFFLILFSLPNLDNVKECDMFYALDLWFRPCTGTYLKETKRLYLCLWWLCVFPCMPTYQQLNCYWCFKVFPPKGSMTLWHQTDKLDDKAEKIMMWQRNYYYFISFSGNNC